MESNELRVGNWIYMGNEFYKFKPTDFTLNFELMDFKPIELSPEILEKVGFAKGVGETYGWEWEGYKFHITKDGFVYTDQWYKQNLRPIKHIHQLQNLYFALTGTELEINLK